MKKLTTFILSLLFALSASAQADSTQFLGNPTDTIHLTITAWKYGYIAILSPDKDQPEEQAYIRRMVKKWNGVDTMQKVTTVTTLEQTLTTYKNLSISADGLVADFNSELLKEIIGQVMRKPWLLMKIMEYQEELAERREKTKVEGIKYLERMKQSMILD